jgi:hypothetical protein
VTRPSLLLRRILQVNKIMVKKTAVMVRLERKQSHQTPLSKAAPVK